MIRQFEWKSMTDDEKSWLYKRGTAAESAEELRPAIRALVAVSYTHLTLPTIYSV